MKRIKRDSFNAVAILQHDQLHKTIDWNHERTGKALKVIDTSDRRPATLWIHEKKGRVVFETKRQIQMRRRKGK
jgi:hypothetical protein